MRLEEGYVQFFFLSFDEHRHVILDVILKNVYSCQLILWLVKRITVIRNSKWFAVLYSQKSALKMRYQGARDSRSGANEPLALLHQYAYSPYCSPYIS